MSTDQERGRRVGVDRSRREVLAGPADANDNSRGSRHGAGTVVPIGSDTAARNAQRQRHDLVLLLSVADVARALGLGRSKTYELIAAGELEVVHIGRSARVPVGSVEAYVDRLRRDSPGCPDSGTPATYSTARRAELELLPVERDLTHRHPLKNSSVPP